MIMGRPKGVRNGEHLVNPICRFCKIPLNDSNWHDCRRDTRVHGRVHICKDCENKKIKIHKDNKMNALRDEWGNSCCFCGETFDDMVFHEIDWVSHLGKNTHSYYRVNFPRFIYVCRRCHTMIHQIHNITGKEIEEILSLLGFIIIRKCSMGYEDCCAWKVQDPNYCEKCDCFG
jgi:hypothetical protein